ncbi:MAG: penicillin acylase family protein [Bacteroidota bacterium]
MSLRAKILVGVGVTFVFVVLTSIIVAYYLVTKSFPKVGGSLSLSGLQHDVKIYRDEFGVPHLVAESDHDAYFAVGFVHAQERLWQMELIRRAGMGRLSEVLGPPALKTDKMFRTLGLWGLTDRLLETIDPETRDALQAYADGVNSFIRSNKGRYPVEFDMLGIEPEEWDIRHSLLVSRLMAWELNFSRWVDILLGVLVERFGEEKAREIFPEWPKDAPVIVPPELKGGNVTPMAMQLLDADRSYRSLMGIEDLQSGSNAWVVSGSKSATGKPILANDPHLVLTTPGRWFELHMLAPNLDVMGATIPGVPFVVIGRNQHIAWGLTNAMMDDEDFYIEDVDSAQHPTRYRFNNAWRPVVERVDTIMVKDALPVLLSVYSTHRGPIINKMESSAQFSRYLLSMRWVGHEISNEARTFLLMNRASTWQQFQEALQNFAAPAQNFVYADVDGNIGYYTGGKLPIRKSKGATLPYPGWTDAYDWQGFVPFRDMPKQFNPPSGFLVTANNKIVDDSYPYHISNLWEPPWRAERIVELLQGPEKFTLEDFQRLQMDLFSPHARQVVPVILHAFEGREVRDKEIETALSYFRNWNFEMRPDDISTTLFQATFLNIIRNTFRDEMGDEVLGLYDTLSSVPMTVTTRLLEDSVSTWFDNISTPQHETRDDIVRLSLGEALHELKLSLGGELKEWRWGRLHKLTFGHVFGGNELLKPIFNVGPFSVGGSHSTVCVGEFRLANPFVNTVGASTRQIFDLSNPDNNRAVTPPGQSGHVFNRHYQDQVGLWLNGGYRTTIMTRSKIEQTCSDVLTLHPE